MKQVIYCDGCGTITRVQGAFTALLTRKKRYGEVELSETEKVVIKLCRNCAKEAGYKVGGKHDPDNRQTNEVQTRP